MTELLARRSLLAGQTLAAVLADPLLTADAAATLEPVTTKTASGKTAKAFVAKPGKKAPAVLLIHEWWGLNDQVKAVAAELAGQGYVALCADLYDGKVTSDAGKAGALMEALDPKQATETVAAWIAWLKKQPDCTGKIGTLGWCMGGGWSLNASIAAPVDATVIYYGNVTKPAAELKRLKGPVLGHFATRDQWINKSMVDGFVAEMKKAGKPLEAHWYEADHAFANPTGQNFQKPDAQKAWKRTLDFLKAKLS
jgi:carboxymethylenebutenolidase